MEAIGAVAAVQPSFVPSDAAVVMKRLRCVYRVLTRQLKRLGAGLSAKPPRLLVGCTSWLYPMDNHELR